MSAGAGAMVGAMIGRNLVLLQDGCDGAEAAWGPLLARGLALGRDPVSALVPIRGGKPRLDGVVGGVPCRVTVRTDAVHYAETDVVAAPPGGARFKLGVWGSRGGVIGALRDWVHGDVKLGDAAFDERFLITADPAEAAARALSPAVRERLTALAAGGFVGLVAGAAEVTLTLSGVELDPEALGLALDVVAAVAAA